MADPLTPVNQSALNLQTMAEEAYVKLRQKLKFIPNTRQGKDAKWTGEKTINGKKFQKYEVPKISGGTVGERSPGAEVETSLPDSETVDILTVQKYYALEFDESMLSGDSSRHVADFIENGTNELAKKTEQDAFRDVTNDALLTKYITGASGDFAYDDIISANVNLLDDDRPEDDLHIAMSHQAKKDVLGESEYADANILGFDKVHAAGQPLTKLSGLMPHFTSYVYSPYLSPATPWSAKINGAGVTDVVTTIPYDTGAPDNGGRKFHVIKIESEYILVTAVTPSSAVAGDLTVVRGIWGSTPAAHADTTDIDSVANKITPAWNKRDIMTIMPPSEVFNDHRGIKQGVNIEGLAVYVLQEAIPKKSGSLLYTIFLNFGIKIIEGEGVVALIKNK